MLHLGSLSMLFFIALPPLVLCLIGGVIILHFLGVLFKHVLKLTSNSLQEIVLKSVDIVKLTLKNGAICEGRLLSSHFISRYLIILHVKLERKFFTIPIVLFQDSESFTVLRRLRARLLIQNFGR
jgi:hypothetical protein